MNHKIGIDLYRAKIEARSGGYFTIQGLELSPRQANKEDLLAAGLDELSGDRIALYVDLLRKREQDPCILALVDNLEFMRTVAGYPQGNGVNQAVYDHLLQEGIFVRHGGVLMPDKAISVIGLQTLDGRLVENLELVVKGGFQEHKISRPTLHSKS
ncbi:hypothetical protein ACFL1B_04945 [Nanoarchaeota archaeon]